MTADLKQSDYLTGKILTSGQVPLAATNTTVFTVAARTAVTLATFSLTNVTGSAVTVTVSVVPSGGVVDGTHEVVHAFPLAAGDSTSVAEVEDAIFDAGAFVSINASAPTAIDYLITGAVSS
jgi:hypothetical protein